MTNIRGNVWPDHEFPAERFAYHADRDAVHDFGTPPSHEPTVRQTVEKLKSDPHTFRLRVARYQLVEVEEIECIGQRPTTDQLEEGHERDRASGT